MNQVKVTQKRHIAKTISYRILSTLVGFLIMWILTGKIEIGVVFSLIELLYKPIQYYLHERIWYKWINYGLIDVSQNRSLKSNTSKVFKKKLNFSQQKSTEIKEGSRTKKSP